MSNNRAFHAAAMPLQTASDAMRFLKAAAGRKHDLTGVVISAGDLRTLAAILRESVYGNTKLPERTP